jgi:type IV pilus assembly protein PilA
MLTTGRTVVKPDQEGFTLIELLVVVLVLGIVAAIAFPTYHRQMERAYRANVQADLRNAATAMESSFLDLSTYPSASEVVLPSADGVILQVVWPPPAGTEYCVTGAHERLPGETWMIFSTEGTVRTGDCS